MRTTENKSACCPAGTGHCPFLNAGTACTAEIRMFRALPDKSQHELRAAASVRTCGRDEILFEEGSSIDAIIVIRKGKVKLCHLEPSGDEFVLDILHEGQAIWHDIFLKDHLYHYAGICLEETEVCLFSRDRYMHILETEKDAALSLIAMLNTELTAAKEKAVLLSIRDPEIRLAGFMLEQDSRNAGREIHMSLEDIAASIGIRPETVSRNMMKLQRKKLITRVRRGILKVTDRAALLEMVQRETPDE